MLDRFEKYWFGTDHAFARWLDKMKYIQCTIGELHWQDVDLKAEHDAINRFPSIVSAAQGSEKLESLCIHAHLSTLMLNIGFEMARGCFETCMWDLKANSVEHSNFFELCVAQGMLGNAP